MQNNICSELSEVISIVKREQERVCDFAHARGPCVLLFRSHLGLRAALDSSARGDPIGTLRMCPMNEYIYAEKMFDSYSYARAVEICAEGMWLFVMVFTDYTVCFSARMETGAMCDYSSVQQIVL